MKTRSAVAIGVVGVSLILAGFYGCQRSQAPSPTRELATAPPSGAVAITISSTVPSELNEAGGGAPKATMQQAAAFAWQEFIALNWPAVNQTGGVVNNAFVRQRDVPDNNCKFGDPNCAARPLVWETFRGKVEIFPGLLDNQQNALPPPGYPSVATGDDSFGYDALPTYNYASPVLPCSPSSSPTSSPTPVPSFINLDETDQITLDSMFAGVGPAKVAGNSSPQLIRFLAKANRVEYTYVTSPGAGPNASWWAGPPVVSQTQAYLAKNKTSPPAGGHDLVSLPLNTIEIKAGWRVLNDAEIASKRFKTATARYYENPANPCYTESTFGLVSLHIIQKTQSAPYFIYATFEQADNIMTAPTATASPTPVEDVDGNIVKLPPCRADQTAPCPTTPSVTLQDTPIVTPPKGGAIPPQINLVPANAAYCTNGTGTPPPGQLYYLNAVGKIGTPRGGFICVNYRDNAIPQPIIEANRTAHDAMKAYNQMNGIADSPFLYYKLINVQYMPIDKQSFGLYNGNDPNSCQNPACYYLANIVVETNYTLQLFSSSFLGTGSKSEYDSQFNEPSAFPTPAPSGATVIHKNLFYNGTHYNMGGCMGCHGSQGQQQGGDFSVILANGSVSSPEAPAPVTPSGATEIRRNRVLKY